MNTLRLKSQSCAKLLTFAIAVSLFVACADQKDPNIEAATKIHNEASAIAEGIEAQIEGIDSLQMLLTEKRKTAINPAAAASIDSTTAALAAVAAAFETWEQNIIEVPGMVHDHAAGEHHHHDHKPAPNVTSAQMLEIQKEMKTNIEKIKTDFTRAEAMVDGVMK